MCCFLVPFLSWGHGVVWSLCIIAILFSGECLFLLFFPTHFDFKPWLKRLTYYVLTRATSLFYFFFLFRRSNGMKCVALLPQLGTGRQQQQRQQQLKLLQRCRRSANLSFSLFSSSSPLPLPLPLVEPQSLSFSFFPSFFLLPRLVGCPYFMFYKNSSAPTAREREREKKLAMFSGSSSSSKLANQRAPNFLEHSSQIDR